jgi:hypothetical protein
MYGFPCKMCKVECLILYSYFVSKTKLTCRPILFLVFFLKLPKSIPVAMLYAPTLVMMILCVNLRLINYIRYIIMACVLKTRIVKPLL